MSLPAYLKSGDRARLFPVLAETSKEGRTTSITLACLAGVREFGAAILGLFGQRMGARATLEAYTEVVFHKETASRSAHRPDGLLILDTGKSQWRALVEAKVGANHLTVEQIDDYLTLAAENGVDAVITISNQFASNPCHHPVQTKNKAVKKVQLFHLSWMALLTEADLLLTADDVSDADQAWVLTEMTRFLAHPSAGVKGFDAMPPEWSQLVASTQAGAPISAKSDEARRVVDAWRQEVRDLSLILTRQLGVAVRVRTPRALARDPAAMTAADLETLVQTQKLETSMAVPDAAGPMDITVDVARRTMSASIWLKAPGDRQSSKARLNWLLRQLSGSTDADVHVRLIWPGRAAATQARLSEARLDPDAVLRGREGLQAASFEVCLIRHTGKRFTQAKNVIADLERLAPDFYTDVVQSLRAWRPAAPKIRDDRAEPESVAPAALTTDPADRAGEA